MTDAERRDAVARVRAACYGSVRLPLFEEDEPPGEGPAAELSLDDQLDILTTAWLETACFAREAQRHIPGGVPRERAHELRRLDEVAALVTIDLPDPEYLRLEEQDDCEGLIAYMDAKRDVRNELRFVRARALNARTELLELCGDVEPKTEPVPRTSVGRILAGVLTALQESGNDILAHQYRAVFDRFQATATNLEAINAAGEVTSDQAIAEAIRLVEEMDVAEDAFDRVAADVTSWLQRYEDPPESDEGPMMDDDERAAMLHALQAITEASAAGDALRGDALHSVPKLIADVCATLRQFGEEAFATQYAAAFDRWQAAIATMASAAAFSDDVNPSAVAAKDDASAEFLRLTLALLGNAGDDTTGGL